MNKAIGVLKGGLRNVWMTAETKFLRKFITISLIVLSGLLVSCRDQRQNKVVETKRSDTSATDQLNEERLRLGLKQIGTNWVLYRSTDTKEDWKTPSGFLAKSVFKDVTSKILSEEDYYYSGKQFVDREGRARERITAHYDYKSKEGYLAYSGTNAAIERALSPFLIERGGTSPDMSPAMEALKKATAGWPDR